MKRILLAFIVILLTVGVACSSEISDEFLTKENAIKEEFTNKKDLKNTSEVKEEPKEKEEKKDKQEAKETETEISTSESKVTDNLVVHYIDAGQADATLFQYVHHDKSYTILFDVGDWNRKDVVSYLHNQGISSIDLIMISHPHADHIGQLAQIINEFTVDEVWFSGNTASSGTYQEAAQAVLDSDVDYYEPRAGETFEIGSLDIEILHPSTLTGKLNEDSISVRLTYGEIALIFTGDAYKNEEMQMIKQADNIRAHILQLGHHGSKTSSAKQFVDAVQPEVSIYSAGSGNSYGHPHIETIDVINQSGSELYGTDVHGTIIVTTDGHTYDVTTNATGDVKAGKSSSKDSKPKKDKKKEKPKKEADNSSDSSCIDINKASAEQLENIKHIGPARAEELINQRPFTSVEDMSRIKGIGPARITDIIAEDKACIGGN